MTWTTVSTIQETSEDVDYTSTTELLEVNPWPHTLVSAFVQGLVIAAVLLAAKSLGLF